MKVIDPKSMLIGILITLLVFSTLGLRPKTDELGHLVVRSLTIEDDRGVIMGYLGCGCFVSGGYQLRRRFAGHSNNN